MITREEMRQILMRILFVTGLVAFIGLIYSIVEAI